MLEGHYFLAVQLTCLLTLAALMAQINRNKELSQRARVAFAAACGAAVVTVLSEAAAFHLGVAGALESYPFALAFADFLRSVAAPICLAFLAYAIGSSRRSLAAFIIPCANAAVQLTQLAFAGDYASLIHAVPWRGALALFLAASAVLLAWQMIRAERDHEMFKPLSVVLQCAVLLPAMVLPLVNVELAVLGMCLTVSCCLMFAFGVLAAADDAVAELARSKQESADWEKVNHALTREYLSCHLIDLQNRQARTVKSTELIEELLETEVELEEKFRKTMTTLVNENYLDKVLLFIDFATLGNRLRGRSSISLEFEGKVNGWCRASFHVLRADRWGNPVDLAFVVSVIDEQKRYEAELLAKSTVDSLTGLLNQRSFHEERAGWEGRDLPLDLTMVTLDANDLKTVNDSCGHDAGDDLLRDLGKFIKQSFGKESRCFRTGGDEFCVVMRGTADQARECCRRLDELVAGWEHPLIRRMSVSWGLACAREHPGVTFTQLCRESDQCMYRAKRAFYQREGIDRRSGAGVR
ncbi:MAG: GGDEF domain-containing protein [Eggerthellaceae bacterium]